MVTSAIFPPPPAPFVIVRLLTRKYHSFATSGCTPWSSGQRNARGPSLSAEPDAIALPRHVLMTGTNWGENLDEPAAARSAGNVCGSRRFAGIESRKRTNPSPRNLVPAIASDPKRPSSKGQIDSSGSVSVHGEPVCSLEGRPSVGERVRLLRRARDAGASGRPRRL